MRLHNVLALLLGIFVFLAIIAGLSDPLIAQDVPPPLLPGGPTQTPVDGGLLALGAAGAGYAIKKFRDRRSKLSNRTEHTGE